MKVQVFPRTAPTQIQGNADVSEVLSGKTFMSDGSTSVKTGTMVNRGAVTESLTADGQVYTIPEGYHDGTGTVTANVSTDLVGAHGDACVDFAVGSTGSSRYNIINLADGTQSGGPTSGTVMGSVTYIDFTASPWAIKANVNGHFNGYVYVRDNSTGQATVTSIDNDFNANNTIATASSNFGYVLIKQ